MGAGEYISDEGRGAYRLDDVFLLDLSFQKKFDLGHLGQVTVIVDVINMFDNQVAVNVEREWHENPDKNEFGEETEWISPRYVEFQLKYSF